MQEHLSKSEFDAFNFGTEFCGTAKESTRLVPLSKISPDPILSSGLDYFELGVDSKQLSKTPDIPYC